MSETTLEFNREVLDKEYPRGTVKVPKKLMLDFSQAMGETNPNFVNEAAAAEGPYGGLIASPALIASLVDRQMPEDFDLDIKGVTFAAGQSVQPLLPVRPGDELTCTARIKDVYKKTGRSGTMIFVVVENKLVNQNGELVALVGHSMSYRQ